MARHDDEAALRKGLQERPDDPSLLANLGRLLGARGEAKEALACYRRAASHPEAPGAVFFNLGNALLAGGEVAEAQAQFLQALARDASMAATAIQAGRCAVRLGRHGAAREPIATALRIEPNNFSAGLDAFVARDDADYVRIAREMAADRTNLAALKNGLRERLRAAPAWDADRYAGDCEATLRACCRDWCLGAG